MQTSETSRFFINIRNPNRTSCQSACIVPPLVRAARSS
jgi:hypothetical protein